MKWLSRLLGVLLIVAGCTLAGTPAAAVTCSNGYICFFDNLNGTSLISRTLATAYARNNCYPLYEVENNSISYIYNNSDSTFYVWLNGSCSSTRSPVYARSQGAMNSQWNNSISSMLRL